MKTVVTMVLHQVNLFKPSVTNHRNCTQIQ